MCHVYVVAIFWKIGALFQINYSTITNSIKITSIMEFFFILKLNFDMSDLTLIVLQDQFGQFKQFQQIFFVHTSDLLNVLTYILSKWYDY